MDNIINQIKKTTENFNNVDLGTLRKNKFTDWNGLNLNRLLESKDLISNILIQLNEQDLYYDLSFNIVNALNTNLNTTLQKINQVKTQPSQPNFQNALAQIETLRTHISNWGLRNQLMIGTDLEEKINAFDLEYQSILEKKSSIEELINTVTNLIEPAVAGSLSNSFTGRQQKIKTNRIIWLVLVLISGVGSIIATFWVIDSLVATFSFTFPTNATEKQIQAIIDNRPDNSILHFLRVAILFPFYSLFVYSFGQYKKERDLEEEYAHRSAVATSLPNYGELAGDPIVKDQIISEATKVVFYSPTRPKENGRNENTKSILGEVKGIVENLAKVNNKN